MVGLEQELLSSDGIPTIVIDLVNEVYDDADAYDIPGALGKQPGAVFNSRRIAKIIADKKEANAFLSQNGIPMPSLVGLGNKKIFSNARIGSHEPVFVYDDASEIDENRYNTEFVDTRARFRDSVYYTTVRLMCIGSHLLQIFVRAGHEAENNPSVHTADTPQDRALVDHLYGVLVAPRIEEYSLLAKNIGSALGPGFYAHDLLVDNETGGLFLCESGFKFFDNAYWKRVKGIAGGREFQYNVVNQETHAGHAASAFIAYCTEMGFL